jgi:transcriptional regulator with XRE-family HTH domain
MAQHNAMAWHIRAKNLQRQAGITLDELAERISRAGGEAVTGKGVGHWLNGIREPKLEQIKRLAEALDVTLSELLGTYVVEDEAERRLLDKARELPPGKLERVLPALLAMLEATAADAPRQEETK